MSVCVRKSLVCFNGTASQINHLLKNLTEKGIGYLAIIFLIFMWFGAPKILHTCLVELDL